MRIERLSIRLEIRYLVKRSEKAAYAAPTPEQGKYLNP